MKIRKKGWILYSIIFVLLFLFLWQFLSKRNLEMQLVKSQNYNNQLSYIVGIGPIGSQHIHADVKVYINGQHVDFSLRKYQLTTSYIHFEDGLGDVIHAHSTGLTIGNLFYSIGGSISPNCLYFEGQNYCNGNGKTLKFYVNGQQSNEFGSKVIQDLDKYLISYGDGNNTSIKKQLDSITNLAPRYSANKQAMLPTAAQK